MFMRRLFPFSDKGVIAESLRFAVIAALIVIPFRYWVAQPFIVRGASMDPTFFDGEYLVIDELSYHFRKPQRGEVVVLRSPELPRVFLIKRVIGLPGETVVIANGRVAIERSGELAYLEEPYLAAQTRTYPDARTTLGTDEYFVLGDNREPSLDSRRLGSVAGELITGRTLVRLWPAARAQVVTGTVGARPEQ